MFFILRILLAVLSGMVAISQKPYQFGLVEWAFCLLTIFSAFFWHELEAFFEAKPVRLSSFEIVRMLMWFIRLFELFRPTELREPLGRPLFPAE